MPTNIIGIAPGARSSGYTSSVVGQGGIAPPGSTAGAVTDESMKLGAKQYRQLPGYDTSLANIGANIGAETKGQLPADVLAQIQQQAAERGVATGTGGSQNDNAAYLRALGLSSLDMTNLGQKNFNAALPMLPGLSQNPAFYATPGTNLQANIAGANLANQQSEFAAAQAANDRALAEAKNGLQQGLGSGGGMGGATRLPTSRPGTDALGFSSSTGKWGPGAGSVFGNSLGSATTIGGQYYYPGQATPGTSSPVDQILRNYAPGAGGGNNGGSPFGSETDALFSDDPFYNLFYGPDMGTEASATAPAGTSSGYYYAGPDQSGGDGFEGWDFSDEE